MFKFVNLQLWGEYFSISQEGIEELDELGGGELPDLRMLYTDAELLAMVKEALSPVDFIKFKTAQKDTEVLCLDYVPDAPPAPPAPRPPTPPPTKTAAELECEAMERRVEAARIEAAKKEATKTATSKMDKMRKELEELEAKQIEHDTKYLKKKADAKTMEADLKKTKARMKEITVLRDTFKEAASVDLVWMVDCTYSMDSFLDATKDRIHEFVESLNKLYPGIPLRISFVGYRDHCDGDRRLAVLRFTKDLAAFKEFVGGQVAIGGGDAPEDVFGALSVVKGLEWASASRILFHVADAPCHGSEFHDCHDDFPDGDPNGLKADELLLHLQRSNVEYFFGKISSETDKMIKRFNEIVGGPTAYVKATKMMDATTMMATASRSVSTVLTASLSSSRRTEGGSMKMKTLVFSKAMPVWNTLALEDCHKFALEMPSSIKELVSAREDICLDAFPIRTTVRCAVNPFEKGALRAAYRAQEKVGSTFSNVIQKESMAAHKDELTRDKYEETLACHRAAMFLAVEFNKVKPPACASVEYCQVFVLQFMRRPGQPFRTQESMVEGVWEKYNNNSGYCAPTPTDAGVNHDAVQAFSHWTHHVTEGKLMVVDCQGAYDAARKTFVLSDPALHCSSVLRFGGTNLSGAGFADFLKTHYCNAHCKAMGLPDVPH